MKTEKIEHNHQSLSGQVRTYTCPACKVSAKHTPGPFLELRAKVYRVQKGGSQFCDCYLWDDAKGPNGKGGGVQFYMCHLHAAAPIGLELAQERLAQWHSDSRNMERAEPKSVKLARAFIAKYEGREV